MRSIVSMVLITSLLWTPTAFAAGAPKVELRKPGSFSFEAANGFVLRGEHATDSVVLTATSPWGESVTFHIQPPFDGTTVIDYGEVEARFEGSLQKGAIQRVHVSSPYGEVTSTSAQKQLEGPALKSWGLTPPEQLRDTEAYEVLVAASLAEASGDFWAGLARGVQQIDRQLAGAQPASCVGLGLGCLGALISWFGSYAALIAACGATFGAACVAALLAHEGLNFTVAGVCISWLECLDEGDGGTGPCIIPDPDDPFCNPDDGGGSGGGGGGGFGGGSGGNSCYDCYVDNAYCGNFCGSESFVIEQCIDACVN